ncbi:putative cyclin-D7-1 [Solanum pennellii]|uniref:Cyclin-D7-1 n=1 Tax=Solanum pennellii TaxID=28526 RepID=A0ABM1HLY4_SOLPN|nr:putative cyclin-D7-1 [Solanum pennellii]
MESLLCDEIWLEKEEEFKNNVENSCFFKSKEDCEEAFKILLNKEISYMPKIGYVKFIKENCFIENARFKAIHWLIKSQRRWNLSFGTCFGAASYLDRFISLNKCQGWKYWMFELLSIACLSVSSKFHETSPPQLLELQMEGVEHLFESTMIQRMELTLLETLGWRLNSTTPYSYIELFQWNINTLKLSLLRDFTSCVNDLLLRILLDVKFLEFRPCVIAQSVVTCISEDLSLLIDDSCFNNFTRLIPQNQKDDLSKCQRMMINKQFLIKEYQELITSEVFNYGPSSPVTVLTMDQHDLCDIPQRGY